MADAAGITGDDIKQVQDYMRREFSTLMRPLDRPVYHYTDGVAAANMLDEGRLRATNILYLDDGRDMGHCVDFFRHAMAARLADHPGGATAELTALISQYLSEVGGYVPPDIWIATLTAERDSAHQWDAVLKRGHPHGVAVGFNAAGLVRATEKAGALLAPCCYDDATKVAIMTRGLDLLEKLYEKRRKSGLAPATAEGLVRYVVRELALFGALMKQSDLAHEGEWRVILCNPSQTAVGARRINAIAKSDYTALYIDLDMADGNDLLPIQEILVGPSHHQQMTARAFWTLLYKHGYENAQVVQSHTQEMA
jgi:hypothetical protein